MVLLKLRLKFQQNNETVNNNCNLMFMKTKIIEKHTDKINIPIHNKVQLPTDKTQLRMLEFVIRRYSKAKSLSLYMIKQNPVSNQSDECTRHIWQLPTTASPFIQRQCQSVRWRQHHHHHPTQQVIRNDVCNDVTVII